MKISKNFDFLSLRTRFPRIFNYHHPEIKQLTKKIFVNFFARYFFQNFTFSKIFCVKVRHFQGVRHFKEKFCDSRLHSPKNHLTPTPHPCKFLTIGRSYLRNINSSLLFVKSRIRLLMKMLIQFSIFSIFQNEINSQIAMKECV